MDYFKFMAHISGVYRQQLAQVLSDEMLGLLQQYHTVLNPELRLCIVACLKIMRNKDVVPGATVLPVFLKLFKCPDKELRSVLHASVVSDMKEINKSAKNHAINRKLQNFILGMLQDPSESAARKSLNVMIELYKRQVWRDDRTVNAIWAGVMHDNPKIVASAAKFFLILDYDHQSDNESVESSEAEDAAQMLKHHKGSKLTK